LEGAQKRKAQHRSVGLSPYFVISRRGKCGRRQVGSGRVIFLLGDMNDAISSEESFFLAAVAYTLSAWPVQSPTLRTRECHGPRLTASSDHGAVFVYVDTTRAFQFCTFHSSFLSCFYLKNYLRYYKSFILKSILDSAGRMMFEPV
jgi:hypothetical protein